MVGMRRIKPGQMYMGRLRYGADLLKELTRICLEAQVGCGRLEAIGAVQRARIGYYDQKKREYGFMEFEEELEITALLGNVSIKDEKPMVHAHVTLANTQGRAYGGHLAPGTVIFACEYILQAFDEPTLVRGFDQQTGLALWTMAD
ncbi:MAG: DNA-binding protein [Desulforhabdus sp.]|nr:DNA-binding protein [Desulforhabdus sp.]